VPPHALFVIVRDSISGAFLTEGTIGTADAAGIHDTLVVHSGDSTALYSAHNQPGTYKIVLHRPGYQLWEKDGIAVVWGRCGGGNVGVLARLQPANAPSTSHVLANEQLELAAPQVVGLIRERQRRSSTAVR
jgi:hypothetical protein